MRKALFATAIVIIVLLIFQACGPSSDFAKSREIVNAVVATPPVGYVAGEVSRPNWLSTSGDGQNFKLLYSKSLTTESVDSECFSLINWATGLGASKFMGGHLGYENPLIMLSGNEDRARQTCVEILSLGMDPAIESGSSLWLMYGNYHGDDISVVDFGVYLNHSYDQEPGKIELTHNMNVEILTNPRDAVDFD
jgi:hypothetical protein